LSPIVHHCPPLEAFQHVKDPETVCEQGA
jgi:hypothetical protein